MSQDFASLIKATPHLALSYPVEANQVTPPFWILLLQEKIFCYLWHLEKNEVRFIASWNTSEQDVENLKAIFAEIPLKHI